ncbi:MULTISPECIES: glycosyltransferase family 9 protein [unclassified Spirosoma]|uniref:glycosyltransferase family 9 protein n=1 Tax=unclassified Spirosoma TaxID=2621999 RepID=UPI000958E774|nr:MULTISPECIES: glycosyltransferase family 9 protein [unclassified Spirosoma]MBN8821365.1 glycosyltransferase family 9 protein [Spirosoma sp.]OJW78152.1 MAG: glycosyl transferase [Spirosoma sp. 48-14]
MNEGPRFRELWTYRFHKYTHIVGKFWSFWAKYVQLWWLKQRHRNRPLVAIILSEQMGDIIACEPVAKEVRRRHPNDYIIWVVRKPYLDLVKYHPDLDGYLIEKCPGERVRLLRSGIFDKVYNLHISHRKCKYCLEDPVNPIADQIGLNFDNYYDRGDLLYVFPQAAGLPALTADPKMYIPERVRQKIASLHLPDDPIVIHCQSSHVMRDWPAANWNKLVQWIINTYPNPVIEIGLTPTITLEHPHYRSVCGQLSLLETAEVIRQACLFIGIDSGPAHMANAVETDGIILLGKLFDFVDYLPYSGRYKRGEGITILNHFDHHCADLPYGWVQKAVAKRLGQPKFA